MAALSFELMFATSFRFGTGQAGDGLDEVIDQRVPISAAGIKGVLRDEARWLLPPLADPSATKEKDHPFVAAVFGDERHRCPWNFDVVVAAEELARAPRASLQLDEDGHAVDGALHVKEEVFARSAQLDIYQRVAVTGHGLPTGVAEADRVEYHLALLHLSARAAEKVGQKRSRGMGWVSLVCAERNVAADLDLLLALRKGGQS